MKDNVGKIVSNGLCTSCGVCNGICPHSSIAFHYGKERNTPVVDKASCVNCGLCYDVCPGKGIELVAKGHELFGNQTDVEYNKYCGYQLASYTGHSSNEDIRYHSASGGMVTSFLIYLLDKKIVDGALVVRYSESNPFEPEPFIATTKEEVLASRGSKYLVLSYDKVINDIKAFSGKLVVVGLPCQIQGLRNFAEKNKKVRETILGYFSIYCSLNKTKHSMDYYLEKYQIKRDDVGYFSFRDDGCLGYMKFADKEGNVIKKIPYLSFWFGTHSFFQNRRCTLCADHFGELSDISFGDINIAPYNEDKIGISSLVVRSSYWDSILEQANNDGAIVLNSCLLDDVISSQGYSKVFKKGAGIQSYLVVRRLFGKKNPVYDIEFEGKPSIKNYIGVFVKYFMLWIGSHRSMWFVIKKLDHSDGKVITE